MKYENKGLRAALLWTGLTVILSTLHSSWNQVFKEGREGGCKFTPVENEAKRSSDPLGVSDQERPKRLLSSEMILGHGRGVYFWTRERERETNAT